jgi:FMN-dependent NADH-azoreductase
MPKLLHIQSSPRAERSHSRFTAQAFVEAYTAAHPGATVETWDVWEEALPEFNGATLAAKYRVLEGQEQQSPERQAWDQVVKLVDRFKAADHYLISAPMWNFGIPYKLKHLIDVLAQPGLTFGYDPAKGYFGLVTGKKAALVLASGGHYGPGSGAEAIDFQKPYLEHMLRFFGITDISAVTVGGTLYGPEAAAKAREEGVANARRIAASL